MPPYPFLPHICAMSSTASSTCIHIWNYRSVRFKGRHRSQRAFDRRGRSAKAAGPSPKKRFSFPSPLDDNLVITPSHPPGPACFTLTRLGMTDVGFLGPSRSNVLSNFTSVGGLHKRTGDQQAVSLSQFLALPLRYFVLSSWNHRPTSKSLPPSQ